jgi:hypothetical protein
MESVDCELFFVKFVFAGLFKIVVGKFAFAGIFIEKLFTGFILMCFFFVFML